MTSCLILFKETVDVYYESYMHYIYTYIQVTYMQSYGTCSYHCTLSEACHEIRRLLMAPDSLSACSQQSFSLYPLKMDASESRCPPSTEIHGIILQKTVILIRHTV